jgi:tRNA1(Val) A37 N6-methylase TrmN6
MKTTQDRLLGGRISLFQPAKGYRVAIDPVFLAAAVPPQKGVAILDLGIGTGAVSLCLRARMPACPIVGLDNNAEYLELARKSFEENGMAEKFSLHFGNIQNPPAEMDALRFDIVVANPPYFEGSAYSPSPDAGKSQAHANEGIEWQNWVNAAAHFLTPEGTFFVIFPGDKQESFLPNLKATFDEVKVFSLLQRANGPVTRLIVAAKGLSGAKKPVLEGGKLALHQESGAYTDEAEAVLRQVKGLDVF